MTQLELFPPPCRVVLHGDDELVGLLEVVIERGFPGEALPEGVGAVMVRWNGRLRSTVGRAIQHPVEPVIEVSPVYDREHPGELSETLAHEYAHLLHPLAGHGRPWRRSLERAMRRLGLPLRGDIVRARHPAPHRGRYEWRCRACRTVVAVRSQRRWEEVAVLSTCCGASVSVHDVHRGLPAAPRPHQVGCRACGAVYAAFAEPRPAERFARRYHCRCGHRLRTTSR